MGQMVPEPRRILIVDDDVLILQALKMVLETDRHIVETACGGAAGIACVEAANAKAEPYFAVLTDLNMPGIDGHRVAQAVKALTPQTAVVLMTGSIDVPSIDGQVPVDMILSKPPNRTELRLALQRLTERRIATGTAELTPRV